MTNILDVAMDALDRTEAALSGGDRKQIMRNEIEDAHMEVMRLEAKERFAPADYETLKQLTVSPIYTQR